MDSVTEILIDVSSSMEKKISAVKQLILNDIIPELDFSYKIGIKTFTTLSNSNRNLDINTVLPLSIVDKETILLKINSLASSKNGRTPIAAAIRKSVESLSEYVSKDKIIILVTDGGETEGGNYVDEATKAAKNGFNCKIHVVGLDLNEESKKQATQIAQITGGSASFLVFQNQSYNNSIAKSNLTDFRLALKKSTTSKSNSSFDEVQEFIREVYNNLEEVKSGDDNTVPERIENQLVNEEIRSISEKYVYDLLSKKYPNRVKWLNANGESKADHDFEIHDLDNSIEYYVECKGTNNTKPTFYLTKFEWRLFLNHTNNYHIYFVQNCSSKPNHIFINNLLDWILKGKIVPYLKERDIIEEGRVFLSLNEIF